MDRLEAYREGLRKAYGDARWIVALDVLASARPLVEALHALGVQRCLCVAGSRGTGDPPDPALAPDPIILDVRAGSIMEGIRASLDAIAALNEAQVAQIDAFDPERRCRVITPFYGDGRPVAGRSVYGGRPLSWQALEDKTTIDALWDTLGVTRAPALVVEARLDALRAAARELDQGSGTVWVGDNREGFHGGAEFLRWVHTPEEEEAAAAFLSDHSDHVRVMPFIEGIPCSIHGVVMPGEVLSLRPCEMLVFRRPGSTKLHYASAATFWDPAPSDREEMRALAKRVGEHLRRRLDYRGAFTIDGIMSAEGFIPTELNPRFGAALNLLGKGIDGLPLTLLNFAIIEGADFGDDASALEDALIQASDRERSGRGIAMSPRVVTDTARVDLRFDPEAPHGARLAADGEEPDASAILGPAATGAFASVTLSPTRTPIGPSAAPRIITALRFLDELWALGVGELAPALDVR